MLVTYRGKWWDPYSCENVPMLMQVLSEMFRDLLSPAPCVSAVIKGALPRVSVVWVSWSLSCLYTRMLLLLLLSRFSRVRLCATPQTAAHQAPPSLGFSGKEHRSGLPFPSPVHEGEKWKWSCSVVSDSQRPHGLQPTRLLPPWDFPGRSTEGTRGLQTYRLKWKSRLQDSEEKEGLCEGRSGDTCAWALLFSVSSNQFV